MPLAGFAVRMLGADVALVTHRSTMTVGEPRAANRSSIWRGTADGWQLEFHQGTPVATLTVLWETI